MKWLETHKHLAMALLAVLAILVVTHKVIAYMAGKAHDSFVLAQHQQELDAKAQAVAEKTASDKRAASDAIIQQMEAKIASQNARISALQASLSERRQQDLALPPPELAERWEGLAGALPGSIRPVPDGLVASLDASHKTVALLEEVPVDREVITSQTSNLGSMKQELRGVQDALTAQVAATAACKTEQVSAAAACKAEVAEVKAAARKRGFWLTLLGALGGFFGRGAL